MIETADNPTAVAAADALLTEPTLRVRDYFERYRGARIYHPPLTDDKGMLVGNNGDHLMVLGTERLYADYAVERIDDPKRADLIVIGASGGMLEKFAAIPELFERCCRQNPDTPVCVLPSSFYYPHQPFGRNIGDRTAPVTLFCREPYSYRHLTRDHKLPACCDVELDHDLAFELEGSDWIRPHLAAAQEQKHVLVVERTDAEHHAVQLRDDRVKAVSLRKKLREHLPEPMKRMLYPLVMMWRGKQRTTFVQQCDGLLAEHYPQHRDLPRINKDLSHVRVIDFDGFVRTIRDSAVVFTTRLHVGILAAMLHKPTFIFTASYHKIQGIYRFSLAGREGVRLLEPKG